MSTELSSDAENWFGSCSALYFGVNNDFLCFLATFLASLAAVLTFTLFGRGAGVFVK